MKASRMRHAGVLLLLGLAACDTGPGPAAPPLPLPTPGPSTNPTPLATPSPAPANQPPRLDVRVTPTPITGQAPLTVKVNLCRSSDPEADVLSYVYEYQGEGKRFSSTCEEQHVYAAPVQAQAVFCVSDGLPRHLVCRPFRVTID